MNRYVFFELMYLIKSGSITEIIDPKADIVASDNKHIAPLEEWL